MLTRMGSVVWWFGLVMGLVFFGSYAVSVNEHSGCTDLLAKADAIEAKQKAEYDAWSRAHPGAGTLESLDFFSKQIDEMPPREEVAKCRRGADVIPLFVGAILVAFSWSLAFVLGGSFWKPPAPKESRFISLSELTRKN
jgi:hypothetical protein